MGARIGKITLTKSLWPTGWSLGLEFDYVAGKIYDRWMVWSRRDGVVAYVVDEKLYHPDQNDIFNRNAAMKELERLCGNPPCDFAAIDSTP